MNYTDAVSLPSRAAQAALAQLVTDKLGLQPDITMVEPGTLPRFETKGKRFFIGGAGRPCGYAKIPGTTKWG